MKKLIRCAAIFSMALSLTTAFAASAYDFNYEMYESEYTDDTEYIVKKNTKCGVFSDENSIFDGCDIYSYEFARATSPNIKWSDEYEYLVVPSDIIGDLFSNDVMLQGMSYDVKMPLRSQFTYGHDEGKPVDMNTYVLTIVEKDRPTGSIRITAEEGCKELSDVIDTEKLAEQFPKAASDSHQNYADGTYTHSIGFRRKYDEPYFSLEEAREIAKMCTDKVLTMEYCYSVPITNIYLSKSPIYAAEEKEGAAAVFKKHGYEVTEKDPDRGRTALVPDREIPAVEYYEILLEIRRETGAFPSMWNYDIAEFYVQKTDLLTPAKGDLNGDGSVGVADIVHMQKYLYGISPIDISADLNDDGSVDVYDMVVLRHILINK